MPETCETTTTIATKSRNGSEKEMREQHVKKITSQDIWTPRDILNDFINDVAVRRLPILDAQRELLVEGMVSSQPGERYN
jgi:hypothetical protein